MTRISNPPIKDPPILETNLFSVPWVQWFQEARKLLSGGRPFPLQSFTMLTLPLAVEFPECIVYVSDAPGGPIPAYSDGVQWLRFDGTPL